MISVSNKLREAWFELLDGNLSIDGTSVPVYRTDAPPDAPAYYVVLRYESSTDNSNNHGFVTNPVILTEVYTRFGSGELIRDNIAARIDNQIVTLAYPTPSTHGLGAQSGIQIVNVKRQGDNEISEDDGTYRSHRIIGRNYHRIKQR